jgi:hypothetical protein
MFVLKKKGETYGSSGCVKAIYMEPSPHESRRLCFVQTWGFDSCAVMNLYSFSDLYELKDKFNVDEFLTFLRTIDEPTWQPREAYFLVSAHQLKNSHLIKALVKHPKVRPRDKFYNKAHGPNCVTLFRWSDDEDFKRRVKNVK